MTQDDPHPKAPVQVLVEILKDPDLSDEQKEVAEKFLRGRFGLDAAWLGGLWQPCWLSLP